MCCFCLSCSRVLATRACSQTDSASVVEMLRLRWSCTPHNFQYSYSVPISECWRVLYERLEPLYLYCSTGYRRRLLASALRLGIRHTTEVYSYSPCPPAFCLPKQILRLWSHGDPQIGIHCVYADLSCPPSRPDSEREERRGSRHHVVANGRNGSNRLCSRWSMQFED